MVAPQTGAPIERGGFLLFLGLVTFAAIYVVFPFLTPLLWAALAAIMFQPLYLHFLKWCRGRESWAAALSLLFITVVIIVPFLFIGGIVLDEVLIVIEAFRQGEIDVAGWFDTIFTALPAQIQNSLLENGFGDMAAISDRAQDFAEESIGLIATQAVSIGSSVASWVLAFAIGLYVTFFLLRDGQRLGPKLVATLPMEVATGKKMAERFLSIVRATIKGSIVVGIVQGTLGGILLWIAGMPSAILFGVLMGFFSLLPAIGTAIVWLPAGIYLLAVGDIWQGVLVIVCGFAVIGMVDNVLRPILVGRDTGIPDWIILVSTLGGIAAMGFTGIVVGPVIAGLFLSAWSVFGGQEEDVGDEIAGAKVPGAETKPA